MYSSFSGAWILFLFLKYRKIPKNSDIWKFAVINLKFEQGGFTLEYVMHPTMLMELQTVKTLIRLLL